MAAIDLPDLRGKLRLDLSDLQRAPTQVRAAIARMQAAASGDPVKVPVEADDDDVVGGVRTAHRVGQAEADRNPINVPVRIDRRGLEALAQRIRDIRTISSATIAPVRDLARTVTLVSTVAGAAAAALSGGIGLVGGIVAFTTAASAAAGAAPLLVSALTSVGAVAATLKIGLSGVGKALKETFKDAFEEISPTAARFVGEIKRLVPELVGLRNAVQGRLFIGLGQEVRSLAERYLPTLRRAAVAVAGVLRGVLGSAIRDLNTTTNQWRLAFVLDSAKRSLAAFAPSVARLPGLFLKIAEVAAPVFERLARAGADSLGRLLDSLEQGIASGGLARGINAGVQAFRDLGGILAGVFRTFQGISRAATAAFGTTLLGQVAELARRLADLVASAPGQEFLRSLFSEALPVIRQIGDLLVGSVLPGIGRLLPVVADLATAFLTGLEPVIPVLERLLRIIGTGLAPLLPAVSEFAVALGTALADGLAAIAPSLPIIANGLAAMATAIGGGLGTFFQALAPVLPGVAEAFAGFALAFGQGLAAALVTIAPTLPAIADAFVRWFAALTPVLPVIMQAIADAIVAIAPSLPDVALAFTILATALASIAPQVIAAIADAFVQIAPHLPGIAQNLADIAVSLASLTPAMADIIGAIAAALDLVAGAAGAVARNLPIALAGIGAGFGEVVSSVNLNAARIVTIFAGLPSATARHVGIMVGQVIATASRLGPALQTLGAGVVTGFISALSTIIGRAASIAATTTARFLGGISSMPSRTAATMGAVAVNVASALGRAAGSAQSGALRILLSISSNFNRIRGVVTSALSGIPGAIADGLSAAAGAALRAGARIPAAIAEGITRNLGVIRSAISAAASIISGHLPGSPVRYGPLQVLNNGYAGRQVVAMIAQGMLANLTAAAAAMSRLAAALVPPQVRTGPVRLGSVSTAEWNRLLAAGWRGNPNDKMEALYPPAQAAGARIPAAIAAGITSNLAAVRAAIAALSAIITGHLPGSPVREGPLRVLNRGYAGGQIAQMVADGMLGNLSAATEAANRLAAASVPQATPGSVTARAAIGGSADDGRLDLSDRSLRALAALLQPAVYVDGVQQAVDRGLGGRFVTEMR